MPRKATPTKSSGILLTPAMLGVAVACLTLLAGLWKITTAIATKADVESIKSALTTPINDHETRIRLIERQLDRYFGASQAAQHVTPSTAAPVEQETAARLVLAAQYGYPNAQQYPPYAQSAPAAPIAPPRRIVVPFAMIKQFELQPTRGGTYSVLGEDGRSYSVDDVLYILIRMHLAEYPTLRK